MANIKINMLEVKLDHRLFADRYDVFLLKTDKTFFRKGAAMLDEPALCECVSAVHFTGGNQVYILMAADRTDPDRNKRQLKEALFKKPLQVKTGMEEREEREERENIIGPEKVDIDSLDSRIAVSLLANALGSRERSKNRFNNLTGHLYRILPGPDGKTGGDSIKCLEISFHNPPSREKWSLLPPDALMLQLNVRTFTNIKLKQFIDFTRKKPFSSYPQYTFGKGGTLRRRLKPDPQDGEYYILRQKRGKKSEVKFLNVYEYGAYAQSKMGVWQEVLEDFELKYKGICSLRPLEIPADYVRECLAATKHKKDLVAKTKSFLREMGIPVVVVDSVGDKKSQNLCRMVRKGLEKVYGTDAGEEKGVREGALNICIIHNREWYEKNGKEDPYSRARDAVVQYLTLEELEDYADPSKPSKDEIPDSRINVAVQELMVKNDIRQGRFSLFDWKNLEMDCDVSFAMVSGTEEGKDDEGGRRAFAMTVHPDGTFVFGFPETGNLLGETLESALFTGEDVEGAIQYANGDIWRIRHTPLFTITDSGIKEAFHDFEMECEEAEKKGEKRPTNHMRNKKNREALFSGITDIKAFPLGEKDGSLYYFVGVIGAGMNRGIANAANIRKLEPYPCQEGRGMDFEKLSATMEATFVRNGQLTVLPFPFKYLREYAAMQGGV